MAETYLRQADLGRMLKSDKVGDLMREAEMRRAWRHTKFPSIRGNYDFPSFQARNANSASFIQWNLHSAPPHHGYSLAPHRDNHPVLDASSGLVSAGADRDLVSAEADAKEEAASGIPSVAETEKAQEALPRADDSSEDKWNSRKIGDASVRARLADEGRTAVRRVDGDNLRVANFSFAPGNWRDEAAKNFMYTSVTQTNYRAVDWDRLLAEKLKGCRELVSTREGIPLQPARYEAKADVYQRLGPSWDRFQSRGRPHGPRPYDFASHYRRSDQIPGYEGSVGAYNFEDRDDPHRTYRPFTTLRVVKPRDPDASGGPNIPGYSGRVHWTATHQANRHNPIHSRSVSAQVFRDVSSGGGSGPERARAAEMSRMVTTVPPKNPFNHVQ